MAGPSLSEKVLLIEEALSRHRWPHAFGGALALAYYATPRATVDIDVNVFVPVARAAAVLAQLQALGAEAPTARERARIARDGQVRVRWGATPLDLFFSYDALHEACLARRRAMPFGDGDTIHVLDAESLVVFKALFDREKDWRDLEELVFAMGEALDRAFVRDWLERILGAADERYRRLEALFSRHP